MPELMLTCADESTISRRTCSACWGGWQGAAAAGGHWRASSLTNSDGAATRTRTSAISISCPPSTSPHSSIWCSSSSRAAAKLCSRVSSPCEGVGDQVDGGRLLAWAGGGRHTLSYCSRQVGATHGAAKHPPAPARPAVCAQASGFWHHMAGAHDLSFKYASDGCTAQNTTRLHGGQG